MPITVGASFRSLQAGVLGQAGPGGFVEEVEDGRYQPGERVLPVALGNALAGRDLIPPSADDPGFDIEAEFPSNNPDIYYGRGPVPDDAYDFFSTALHEIGHGLGFGSGFRYNSNGTGTYAITNYLLPYDRFLAVGTSGAADLYRMARGGTELGSAIVSNNVYWRGAKGISAAGGTRPRMQSTSPYRQGSSLSHLDEKAYPPGSLNALMTPAGAPGELNAEIGPIALGVLGDLGWSVAAGPSSPASPSPTAPASPVATGPGSRFTPVTPRRLLDTRSGLGLTTAVRVGDDATIDLTVAGGSTGVPTNATAVVLNVTVVGATRATDVRVYPTPTDGTVPEVSNINLAARQTRAGVVTVPVGANGQVRLRNEDGAVSLLADLAGYYSPDGATAFHPQAPVRLLDTRTQSTKKLGPGGSLDLLVAGTAGVPASAAAVVLNVTGVAPTASTDLAVSPTSPGSGPPETSNVNLVPGPPVPNLVVVKVGDGGKIRLRNSSGTTAVLVDLSGWYDATAPGGQLFRPVVPVRLFDTRQETDPARRRLGAGGRGVYRTTTGPAAVPSSATAVLLNVTGVAASVATDVRVYPFSSSNAFPEVSNLNLGAGRTVANAAVVRLGTDGDVLFRNQSGSVALIGDLAGYFAP